MRKLFFILTIFVCISEVNQAQILNKNQWQYPSIKPDTAIDLYFGKKVIDPYRNIEDTADTLVHRWLIAQNKLYDSVIYNITGHEILRKERTKMIYAQKTWASFAVGGGNRIFYPFLKIGHNQFQTLVYRKGLQGKQIEIFSTKKYNARDHCSYSFDYYQPSFDGKYIAFGMSSNGSEKASIYIVDVEKKELLPERIERSRVGNIQWLPDGTGFFYIQDKEIITEEDKIVPNEDKKIRLHLLGTDPKNDKIIFSRLINKNLGLKKIEIPMLFTYPSSDKVLINTVKGGGQYYPIYYAQLSEVLSKPAEDVIWKKICDEDAKISGNALYGNIFFGIDCKSHPDGQLIMMKLPDLTPKVLFKANNFSLDDLVLTTNALYLSCIENGLNKLAKIALNDYHVEFLDLPFSGNIRMRPYFGIASYYQHNHFLLFALSAIDKQWDMYWYDDRNKVFKTNIFPDVQYLNPPLELTTEEILVPSHDGELVPLSIVHKKGIKLDGTNPTIIYAYGAYGISTKPYFDYNYLSWFKREGIYAVAHVRGGYEKGDKWYKGGYKATKSNSWNDLIACAEYLVKNKYTSPGKLALSGASAGGITIGRAITERPDLFKAAVINMGILNTLRMENSFINSSVAEFGTAKDSLEFPFLYEMDTYHHIIEGEHYPSVLFTAASNDSRVPLWQSAKVVAKIQEVSKGNNTVLFRIEDSGHFTYPSDADVFSFLLWQFGHPDFQLKIIEAGK